MKASQDAAFYSNKKKETKNLIRFINFLILSDQINVNPFSYFGIITYHKSIEIIELIKLICLFLGIMKLIFEIRCFFFVLLEQF